MIIRIFVRKKVYARSSVNRIIYCVMYYNIPGCIYIIIRIVREKNESHVSPKIAIEMFIIHPSTAYTYPHVYHVILLILLSSDL